MSSSNDQIAHEALMADLRRVLDAVDASAMQTDEAAKAAFGWIDVEAELAELIFDSAVDEPELIMRSSSGDLRELTFEAATAGVTIDIEIGPAGLTGQIVPPQRATIVLNLGSARSATLHADELGAFREVDLPTGPTSLLVRADDGSWSVRAAWTVT